MEILVIFIIMSIIDKVFKAKKNEKKNQKTSQTHSGRQVQTTRQKPKGLTERIREEIEKGYKELEKSMDPSKTKNIESRPSQVKSKVTGNGERYISDYKEPYEVADGQPIMEGKVYQGDRYISEYEKPYETHGRKTGSQEGKSYKEMDDDFYTRREKESVVLGKGISMRNQVLTGIIYSEILGKPKSQQNRERSI